MSIVLNRRGQTVFVAAMIAIVFIVLALAFAPAMKQFGDNARNVSSDTQVGLDCSNSSISNYDKASCNAVDLFNPYFMGFLVFGAGAIIAARIVGGSS